MKRLENRALWWQFPGLMDEPIGPWSRHLPQARHSRIQLWKLAIDWMADNNVTHFIGVIESHIKAVKRVACPDWPFHYVCRWKDFPGAQIFPEQMLQANREKFRKILGYMKEKGIKPYFHHYSHFAPFNWYANQEELVERKMSHGVTREEALKRGASDLATDLCANADSFREFMRESWRELFEHLPELDGLLLSLAESTLCKCKACMGEEYDWTTRVLKPEFINTMSSFAHHFTDTLKAIGKNPMIRCYHMGGDRGLAPVMPKDATYLIKYSGFNAIDCGPDPICNFWLNEGHDLWMVHELSGSENCSCGMWINPEHSYNVVKRANTKRITGQVAFQNPFFGPHGYAYPGQEINTEAALAAFSGDEYDEEKWKTICKERMGPHGDTYLEAGKLLSRSVLNIDKVVSGAVDDGICFAFKYWISGGPRYAGTVGEQEFTVGTEPHPWRGGPAPLRRFKEYLLDNPWSDDIYSRALKDGEEDPVAFWDEKTEQTLAGLKMVEDLNVPEDDDYLAVHEVMLTASRWIAEFAKFWQGFIHARVYYLGANSIRTPIETQRELAKKCIESLQQSVDCWFALKSLYYDFPVLYLNFGKPFAGNTTVEERYEHYKGILEDIKRQFAPLISGRYYQWPDGGTWTWPEEKVEGR